VDLASAARVALLDGFTLRLDSAVRHVPADDLPRGVQRLVACLSLCGRPARTAIAGQLWPEVAEENAHRSLRSALWRLHKVAPGLVEVSGGALCLAVGVRVDVRELTEWAQRMLDPRSAVDDGGTPDVGLRGELLPGWYDDWVLFEQSRLRQDRLHAFHIIGRESLARGDFEIALEASEAALELEPLYESAVGLLIQAQRRQGNNAAALRAFEKYRAKLNEDMGLVPSVAIRRLVADVL
jgi:DNA-binding SARP family transcriptional activator